MPGKHFKSDKNTEDIDTINNRDESFGSELPDESFGPCDSCECNTESPVESFEEERNKVINLELENQNLKQQLINAQEQIKQKDELINAQARQINLYVTKYNKDEITIDALQDKLLSLIDLYNIKTR